MCVISLRLSFLYIGLRASQQQIPKLTRPSLIQKKCIADFGVHRGALLSTCIEEVCISSLLLSSTFFQLPFESFDGSRKSCKTIKSALSFDEEQRHTSPVGSCTREHPTNERKKERKKPPTFKKDFSDSRHLRLSEIYIKGMSIERDVRRHTDLNISLNEHLSIRLSLFIYTGIYLDICLLTPIERRDLCLYVFDFFPRKARLVAQDDRSLLKEIVFFLSFFLDKQLFFVFLFVFSVEFLLFLLDFFFFFL